MTMNSNRLTVLLEAYGGDPARWPEHEREAGMALLRSDPAAADVARSLDAALDAYAAPPANAALRLKILDATRKVEQTRRFSLGALVGDLLPWRPLWPNLAGLAVALLIGIGVGFSDIGSLGAAESDLANQVALFGYDSVEDLTF